jgi:hypothetical protein
VADHHCMDISTIQRLAVRLAPVVRALVLTWFRSDGEGLRTAFAFDDIADFVGPRPSLSLWYFGNVTPLLHCGRCENERLQMCSSKT